MEPRHASKDHLTTPSVLVIAIGEAHQLLHVLGPAREMFRSGIKVSILVSTSWHVQLIALHAPELEIAIRRAPLFYIDRPLHKNPPRLPNLLLSLSIVKQFDAILTPERTSTILKKLLGKHCPKLLHILHGAGDRAKGYEDRIRLFDHVFVAGQKDRDAFIEYGLATAETCHIIGYCKFDVLSASAPRFFDNDRPVVLYNPHFDPELSSWIKFGPQLVEAFERMPEFNFIIAPHLRLRGAGRRLFDRLAAASNEPNIRFDGGSVHSINMDYTRGADIYVGDVSSQVYEFLQSPKPCVFLNAHGVSWQESPFYRHWKFGEVAARAEDAVAMIHSAQARHDRFSFVQTAGFVAAIAPTSQSPSAQVADIVGEVLAPLRKS